MQDKINALIDINLNEHENAFLNLMTRFYNSSRYDRFNLRTSLNMEQELFINYLQERLNIVIDINSFIPTIFEERIKFF